MTCKESMAGMELQLCDIRLIIQCTEVIACQEEKKELKVGVGNYWNGTIHLVISEPLTNQFPHCLLYVWEGVNLLLPIFHLHDKNSLEL